MMPVVLTPSINSSAILDSSILLTFGIDSLTRLSTVSSSGLFMQPGGATMSLLFPRKSARPSVRDMHGDNFVSEFLEHSVSSCGFESAIASFVSSLSQSLYISSILSAFCKHTDVNIVYVMHLFEFCCCIHNIINYRFE